MISPTPAVVQKENLKSRLSDKIQVWYPGEEMSSAEHGASPPHTLQGYNMQLKRKSEL